MSKEVSHPHEHHLEIPPRFHGSSLLLPTCCFATMPRQLSGAPQDRQNCSKNHNGRSCQHWPWGIVATKVQEGAIERRVAYTRLVAPHCSSLTLVLLHRIARFSLRIPQARASTKKVRATSIYIWIGLQCAHPHLEFVAQG